MKKKIVLFCAIALGVYAGDRATDQAKQSLFQRAANWVSTTYYKFFSPYYDPQSRISVPQLMELKTCLQETYKKFEDSQYKRAAANTPNYWDALHELERLVTEKGPHRKITVAQREEIKAVSALYEKRCQISLGVYAFYRPSERRQLFHDKGFVFTKGPWELSGAWTKLASGLDSPMDLFSFVFGTVGLAMMLPPLSPFIVMSGLYMGYKLFKRPMMLGLELFFNEHFMGMLIMNVVRTRDLPRFVLIPDEQLDEPTKKVLQRFNDHYLRKL